MNSGVKVGPIIKSRDGTQSPLDALMTVKVVVSVKSPSVETRRQDDTVEGGGVVRRIETNKNPIDKSVAGGGGANTRFEIRSVGETGGKEIGGAVGQVSVNVAVLVASALGGNNLSEGRRAREGSGASGGTAPARVEGCMMTKGGNVRRGGTRDIGSVGDEGGRKRASGVGEDTANLGTEPSGRNHGAARACRIDGEEGDAGVESSLDKAGENARRTQNARRKLRVEVDGGGKGGEGRRAEVRGIGWGTRVGENGGEPKAGEARIALCESRAQGRRGEEGGCGLVWIHGEGLVRRKTTADAERWKGGNSWCGARVGNADGAVNSSLATDKVVTTLGQPGIRKKIVKANVVKRGLVEGVDN